MLLLLALLSVASASRGLERLEGLEGLEGLDGIPDGTGLVGGPLGSSLFPLRSERSMEQRASGAPLQQLQQLLPLKMWANPRRSQLRPRRKDMHEDNLLAILGSDYQPGWMRQSRAGGQDVRAEERAAVRALRDLVDADNAPPDLRLPPGLSSEARALVRAWLVRRATCPVRFVWADLGPYFWPRWLRRGECGADQAQDEDRDEDNLTTRRVGVSGVLSEDDDEDDDEDDEGGRGVASRRVNATQSCSWPPGMKCVPGLTRTLHILRWHCRLRKLSQDASFNAIWSAPPEKALSKLDRRQKRSKYRCSWIKVPYSVPEDCVCSV